MFSALRGHIEMGVQAVKNSIVAGPVVEAQTNYCDAILEGFRYLLAKDSRVFTIGQGLWSPWYVGNSMLGLDIEFGRNRVIDSPVSEAAVTGAAIGASLFGYRPIVVHPRMDFMFSATDTIVNAAAKWSYMLGGKNSPAVTIRAIVNRGGEQGAQHSQALHSWFAHIPGLRVVMPASAADARDLLIASVQCDDPVIYIDDRWLYDLEEELPPPADMRLDEQGPRVCRTGRDVTLVGASHSVRLCRDAAMLLEQKGILAEVIDLRVVQPLDAEPIIESVSRTGRLVAVDGSWRNCGLAGEVIASVSERLMPSHWKAAPKRLTLPDAPAPTARSLEGEYYTKSQEIVAAVELMLGTGGAK